MAIILSDNIKINVGKPIDDKYLNGLVPYTSVAEVNSGTTSIALGIRHIGLTVNIANEEYWYKDGITDGDLVKKITSSGDTGLAGIQNIGGGTGEIYSGLSGTTAELRTISGSGNTVVTTSGSSIIIFSEATGNTQTTYTGASPSNIDAGGMTSGTILTGRTLTDIIEDIATTIFPPTYIPPEITFTNNVVPNTREIGSTIGSITFEAELDRGEIILTGVTQDFRSGLPNLYDYTGTDLPNTVPSALTADTQTITNYKVLSTGNLWSVIISYDEGPIPYDSSGTQLPAERLDAGNLPASNDITPVYPWFYGTVNSPIRPLPNQALINSTTGSTGTKRIASSNNTISVTDFNATGEWIWFAIPNSSLPKSKWEGSNSPSNLGNIGGVYGTSTNLFPSGIVVPIDSPNLLVSSPNDIDWTSIDYKIYISNYQTTTFSDGNPYTLTFKV